MWTTVQRPRPDTLDAVYQRVIDLGSTSLEYADKMITDLPDTEVVDRQVFVLRQCLKKVVLDIGCGGPLHAHIKDVADKCYGIDQIKIKDDPDFTQVIIGKDPLPILPDVNLVVCGEVLEHLINPGLFLDELKMAYPSQKKIITVPNAFAEGHSAWIRKGQENTNKDHTAFYTYVTISGLLRKCNYNIDEFYWYDNPEHIRRQGLNEGMIIITS